jgi:4-hydroxy-3-polyprenylbenzoate decarboxylase
MTEDEIAKEMESLIRSAPQSWKELLQHFHGQHYRNVYRAFGRLRPKLGRVVQPPYFPYAFSESGDFIGETPPSRPTRIDRLHHTS